MIIEFEKNGKRHSVKIKEGKADSKTTINQLFFLMTDSQQKRLLKAFNRLFKGWENEKINDLLNGLNVLF